MEYSDAELLEEISRVADELGHQPSLKDFREYGEHSVTTYYERFGSWNDAIKAAGFEPQDAQSKVPKESLVESLQDVADELGHPPSTTEINEHGEYWASTYRNRFGSWNQALEAAGFEPRTKGVELSEEALLDELRRVTDEVGDSITFREMNKRGQYDAHSYVRHFGSWNDALEAADLHTDQRGSETTERELLAEMRRLTDELGNPPSSREMDEQGEYATATYQRRFGSWSAAVDAAEEKSDESNT